MNLNKRKDDHNQPPKGSTFADRIQTTGYSYGLTVEQMANITLYALKSAGCCIARLHDEGDPVEYVLSIPMPLTPAQS